MAGGETSVANSPSRRRHKKSLQQKAWSQGEVEDQEEHEQETKRHRASFDEQSGDFRALQPIAMALLRRRLYSMSPQALLPDAQDNKQKLLDLLSQTVAHGCNNSVLLLGPRGCGKSLVLNQVIAEFEVQYPERVSFVKLSGLLHADDNTALREIAKQLCADHHLTYSKSASFDDNSHFLSSMLRECALAHRTVIFILDDFDLFAQMSKQKLLYNLLNVMQEKDSQAAVIGTSCRLDADQLLEKRVRSRFSHRKILFYPPSTDDIKKILPELLKLPPDSDLLNSNYAKDFNSFTMELLESKEMQDVLDGVMSVDLSPRHIMNFLFLAICMEWKFGFLTLSNFKAASMALQRHPKLESLKDASVLELYLLVSMKRLEGKDKESYNFITAFKEYKSLHDIHSTSDLYPQQVCQRAFENLLERQLIMFADGRRHRSSIEYIPVKLLVSSFELEEALKISPVCPVVLRQWFAHEGFK